MRFKSRLVAVTLLIVFALARTGLHADTITASTIDTTSLVEVNGDSLEVFGTAPPGSFASARVILPPVAPVQGLFGAISSGIASAGGGGNLAGLFGSTSIADTGPVAGPVGLLSGGSYDPDLFANNVIQVTFNVSGSGTFTATVFELVLQVFDTTTYLESAEIEYSILVNGNLAYGFNAILNDNGTPVVTPTAGTGPFPVFTEMLVMGNPTGIYKVPEFDVSVIIAGGPASIVIDASTTADVETGFFIRNSALASIGDPGRFDPNSPNFDPTAPGNFDFTQAIVPEPSSVFGWLVVGSVGLVIGWRTRRRVRLNV